MGYKLEELDFQNKKMPLLICDDTRIKLLKRHFKQRHTGDRMTTIEAKLSLLKAGNFVIVELIFRGEDLDVRFTVPANNNVRWFLLFGHGVLFLKEENDDKELMSMSFPKLDNLDTITAIMGSLEYKPCWYDPTSDSSEHGFLSD